ncbi:MAG TPA: class I SAM-dependent methyltransferase [Actinomycetes bacterium]|nr:class I SAM-dependent methyltransferase [Actinomycetes bacterium]
MGAPAGRHPPPWPDRAAGRPPPTPPRRRRPCPGGGQGGRLTTAQPAGGGLEVPGSRPLGSVVFDRAAGFYDQSRGLPPEVEELVADRVEEVAGQGGRLLEVGVGTGRIALPLHRRGRRVVGVDLSLPMLERYRAKAAAAGLPPPPVLRADATRLPFRDACVDAVLEVHVLHLVPSWELALAEARRVLTAGGVLLHAGGGAIERGSGSPRDQVIGRFDELAGDGGGTPRLVGASHQQVLERLGAMGGRVEELEPVAWEQQETYAEALRWVEERVFSHHWRLPDEVWRASAARVRAEVEAAHPDLDIPSPARHTFRFTAVRF